MADKEKGRAYGAVCRVTQAMDGTMTLEEARERVMNSAWTTAAGGWVRRGDSGWRSRMMAAALQEEMSDAAAMTCMVRL